MSSWLDLAQLITGLAMSGLIWTVQLIVYPAFLHLTPESFPAAHAAHCRRISFIVGPLLLVEWTATLGWLLGLGPVLTRLHYGMAACVMVAILSTFLIQVPLHHRLNRGWDARLLHVLISTNWIRTLAWTAKAILAVLALRMA